MSKYSQGLGTSERPCSSFILFMMASRMTSDETPRMPPPSTIRSVTNAPGERWGCDSPSERRLTGWSSSSNAVVGMALVIRLAKQGQRVLLATRRVTTVDQTRFRRGRRRLLGDSRGEGIAGKHREGGLKVVCLAASRASNGMPPSSARGSGSSCGGCLYSVLRAGTCSTPSLNHSNPGAFCRCMHDIVFRALESLSNRWLAAKSASKHLIRNLDGASSTKARSLRGACRRHWATKSGAIPLEQLWLWLLARTRHGVVDCWVDGWMRGERGCVRQ